MKRDKAFYEDEFSKEMPPENPYDYQDGYYYDQPKKKRGVVKTLLLILLVLVLVGVAFFGVYYVYPHLESVKEYIVELWNRFH